MLGSGMRQIPNNPIAIVTLTGGKEDIPIITIPEGPDGSYQDRQGMAAEKIRWNGGSYASVSDTVLTGFWFKRRFGNPLRIIYAVDMIRGEGRLHVRRASCRGQGRVALLNPLLFYFFLDIHSAISNCA